MEPIEDILSRKPQDDVDALLVTIADSIEEVVNFGTHAFEWFEESVAGRGDEVAPIALFFKHFLEMLDAISVLVRASIVEPSKIQLRSALEAAMSIAWILQEDSERRAMAFIVWNVHEKLKWNHRFDEKTQQGKEFKRKLKDTAIENTQLPFSANIENARPNLNLNTLLTRPKYHAVEEEYQRLREAKIKNPNWYRFFEGPQNIEQLATEVGMTEWYEMFYRKWSGVVHATDTLFGKVKTFEDKTYIRSIRYPDEVGTIYILTVAMALKTYQRILEVFAPLKVEVLTNWYVSEIRDLYIKLSSGDPEITTKPL